MIKDLKKYQGINVLSFFLGNPTLEIHLKEISRRLKISPATAKRFCDLYSIKNDSEVLLHGVDRNGDGSRNPIGFKR